MKKTAFVIMVLLFSVCTPLPAPAHGPYHAPEDNECSHTCHHRLVYCAKLCHDAYDSQPKLDKCLNWCLGKWGKCVQGCESA